MAPEIILYDEKEPIYKVNVDIFSVGVILHLLLVGEQSFPGRRYFLFNLVETLSSTKTKSARSILSPKNTKP